MKGLTITNTTDDIVEILLEHNGTTDLPYAVVPGQSIQIGDIDPAKGVVVRTRSEGWPAVMSGAAPDLSHLNLEGYVRSVLRVLVEKLGDRVDRIEERLSKQPTIVSERMLGKDETFDLDGIVAWLRSLDHRLSANEARGRLTTGPLRVTCGGSTTVEEGK